MEDIIFIRNAEHYKELKTIFKGRKRNTKVQYICEKCKQTVIQTLRSIDANFVCKSCKIRNYRLTHKEEIKQKFKEKYGVENPSQVKVFQEKRKETFSEKYGVVNPGQMKDHNEKVKSTCLERYGCEWPFQNEEVKEKIKETTLQRYNVESFTKTAEYKEKTKETCLKKYGAEHFSKTKEFQEKQENTNLERYGVRRPLQDKRFRKTFKKTCLERYGVENPSQSPEINSKKRHKIPYDGLSFDSEPEVQVYKYCKDHSIPVKYQPCSFTYTDSLGKTHIYFPDFEICGKLYELKGEHLWKDGHIWFPYRNLLGEKELVEVDARDLAKTECMKANNVSVIFSNELNNFLSNI